MNARKHTDECKYNKEQKEVICPAGKRLKLEYIEKLDGRRNYRYRANKKDCMDCENKMLCCPKAKNRGRNVSKREYNQDVKDFWNKKSGQAEHTGEIEKNSVIGRHQCYVSGAHNHVTK